MSTDIGQQAESVAAVYLKQQGFTILARNWRTRWCEIDIVAHSQAAIYFIEAKYRSNLAYGSGLDYITAKKLRQMHFAAEFWLSRNRTIASDYYLAAIELTGTPPRVTNWVSDVG